jgi:hypothetical protein
MAPTDLFHRLKKYYSGDAGTRPLSLFIGPEPFFSGRRGLAYNVAHIIQQ